MCTSTPIPIGLVCARVLIKKTPRKVYKFYRAMDVPRGEASLVKKKVWKKTYRQKSFCELTMQ